MTPQDNVFNILDKRISQLALSRFGEPTSIQREVIPKILQGKNILAIAGTGMGKTESALLPFFHLIKTKESRPIALIYITPMKSLNRDMLDRMLWWCTNLEIDVAVRHGDTTPYERKLQTEHPPQILITTPEQLQGMLTGKKMRDLVRNLKYIVVDELHEIVTSKRGTQLTIAIERLKALCGKPQIVALSATVGSPDEAASFFFGKNNYEIVKTVSEKSMKVIVEYPQPNKDDKKMAEEMFIGESVVARMRRMVEIINSHKSVLTFTNTREAAEVLSSRMHIFDKTLAHEVHHSSLSKDIRIKTETDFKSEKLKNIICTSSLQLGIDIGSVDAIIQYLSPRTVTQFLQRIGRSGHNIKKTSEAFVISAGADDIFESAIIAKKATKGEIEHLKFHYKALDVLCHQIIGLLMENYEMKPEDIYVIIKNAPPYKDLTPEEFNRIVNFLEQLRLIWKDDKLIKRKKNAMQYYFENLSVIPNIPQYKVIDITTNAFVGSLDENFIAASGQAGSTFIVRGRAWKILSTEDGKVYVEPVVNIESSIPGWTGELIPVPYSVAQEVGKIRKSIESWSSKSDVIEKIMESYPVSAESAEEMLSIIKHQMKKHPVPDDNTIVMETYEDYVVLNACFGTLVNETLSRYISALASAERGQVITAKIDPYRIILKGCNAADVEKILKEHKKGDLVGVLERTLSQSSLFKWRFLYNAKRFGAIEKGAQFEKINLDRFIDVYWKSPIFDETLREIFVEKLDLDMTERVLDEIKSKKISLEKINGLSPIAEQGFGYQLFDVAKPNRPEGEIFKLFKKRIFDTKMRLICMNCGKYSVVEAVKDVPNEPRCTHCSSKLIAAFRSYKTEAQPIIKKYLKGTKLTADEEVIITEARRSSDLVIASGKQAVIALAGRGVGPVTASRILTKANLTEDELFKNILNAERKFIETKKFWS